VTVGQAREGASEAVLFIDDVLLVAFTAPYRWPLYGLFSSFSSCGAKGALPLWSVSRSGLFLAAAFRSVVRFCYSRFGRFRSKVMMILPVALRTHSATSRPPHLGQRKGFCSVGTCSLGSTSNA